MALERIILNIIPAGEMPVFHCSQYETGRPVIIDLVSSDDDVFIIAEGVSVELHCRKVDDTIVTLEPDEVDNNTVTFVSTEQLTACPGDNLCELVLYADTDPVQTIGTLNFMLHVEPDPLAGGITSESEIYNLTQQIEDIAHEVIGEDYYDKTEVDNLISGVESQIPTKTSDLINDSDFITSDALTPYAKTSDLATVATTGNYDDLLNKPMIPDAQVQSDWEQADNTKVDYIKNKPDIDAMIANALLEVMPVDTESGSIATFDTEIAAPLVNVSCDIVATGGNGTPDNPNPINGYTEANITRCGVNLFDVSNINDTHGSNTLSINGDEITITWVNGATIFDTKNKQIFKAGNYIIKGFGTNINKVRAYFYRASDNTQLTNIYINTGTVITLTADFYIAIGGRYDNLDTATFTLQLEVGNVASDYTPYNGNTYTIAFGQTVYGGVLDVTRGKLTVTHGIVDLGTRTWTQQTVLGNTVFRCNAIADCALTPTTPYICSNYNAITGSRENLQDGDISGWNITNAYNMPTIRDDSKSSLTPDQFKTAMSGVQLVYPLSTPIDIDLTPEVISAIVGTNNVYSDTNGDTTVQYKDSIQHYIDTRT